MEYRSLVDLYSQLEQNRSTLVKQQLLEEFFRAFEHDPDLRLAIDLLQGQVSPSFEMRVFSISEKNLLRLFQNYASEQIIQELMVIQGDLGTVIEQIGQTRVPEHRISCARVFEQLRALQNFTGKHSQSLRLEALTALFELAEPIERKYIVRTILGKLRIGCSVPTLTTVFGRLFPQTPAAQIRRAFNLHPDLRLCYDLLRQGEFEVSQQPQVFVPISPMLCQRVSSFDELHRRVSYPIQFEEKYDGIRLQLHREGTRVQIFTRNLQSLTEAFPEVVQALLKLPCESCILEGEVVVRSGFSDTARRRRLIDVQQMVQEYPIIVYLFDCLMFNGRSVIDSPLQVRRAILNELNLDRSVLQMTPFRPLNEPETREAFEQLLRANREGAVIKTLDGRYEAGERTFSWIKLKREYFSELLDTIDLFVIGGYYGQGKRRSRYGSFLLGVYDSSRDRYLSIARIGTGFSDEQLDQLKQLLDPLVLKDPETLILSDSIPDVFFRPQVILEIFASGLSESDERRLNRYSLRFPVFTGRIRADKRTGTSLEEILTLFRSRSEQTEPVEQTNLIID